MKKVSTNICGFWFHIKFNENEGICQNGFKWNNPKNPQLQNKNILNTYLDSYNSILNSI